MLGPGIPAVCVSCCMGALSALLQLSARGTVCVYMLRMTSGMVRFTCAADVGVWAQQDVLQLGLFLVDLLYRLASLHNARDIDMLLSVRAEGT